ncbi:hypothetical protein [Rhizobium lentis]|uniref:Uncharacterized protein n=1 Tax=Rhizobium lentis TaxID=1138194 RepID=A0A7W8UK33_9HYPH|nr:hypothetical protein [Rhizobium lentis]MBB4572022.1 hypothetical protein [Rhizobium lentis]MBB5548786.1 hypothetical protein [Rhizobium lentis]MBB5559318.1 hypothetical protein [Rhizobium lentis]MBB5565159.1 hypothetical protein [Rhizobium lentis]
MGNDDSTYGSPSHGFTGSSRRGADSSAREVMRAFEDGLNLVWFTLLARHGTFAGASFMIREQRRAEWFLISGMMSHPTPQIGRSLGKRVQHVVASSCESRDVALVADHLRAMGAAATRLENFLACTRRSIPSGLQTMPSGYISIGTRQNGATATPAV